jgi:hypothetical protein
MYEHKRQRLLSRRMFFGRMLQHVAAAAGLVLGSLLLGIAGYMRFESLSLVDAFLNAAMLLGGMGPVNPPLTTEGKIFAACYALYAGLVFLVVVGISLAPLAHRMLHRLHLEDERAKD